MGYRRGLYRGNLSKMSKRGHYALTVVMVSMMALIMASCVIGVWRDRQLQVMIGWYVGVTVVLCLIAYFWPSLPRR